MAKVIVIITLLLQLISLSSQSTLQFSTAYQVASSLERSFATLSLTSVVGNERILFGPSPTTPRPRPITIIRPITTIRPNTTPRPVYYYPRPSCCTDNRAFAGHPNKVDLVIALDESGSVGSSNFDIMKTFIEDIASHFVVSYSATRVAVVTWSTGVTLEFNFDKYINNEGVRRGINGIEYSGGWTATGDALNYIRRYLFSQSTRGTKKVLFIITDGKSNKQRYSVRNEAYLLKRLGVEIFSFGIGSNVHDTELTTIASVPTASHKFILRTFIDLSCLNHLIGSTGCTGYTAYDACARKCKCRNGKLTDCTRIRKNFLDMTDLERCRYIRAVKKASTIQPFKSEYDRLIGIHEQLFSSGIHTSNEEVGFFLPWHRWYILAYENILRKVDCRVTVPYWDWSLDSDSPFTSDVWNTDLCKYTGLGGNGNPSCVTTGPFASPGWRLTPSAGNRCLRRRHGRETPSCIAVQDILDLTTTQFSQFHFGLERTLHNVVHGSVGGTMITRESSNAPEFFLHHGFIDKLWGDWQEKGFYYKIHHYYNVNTVIPGTVYSPRDVHDLKNQPQLVNVYYEEPDQLCTIGGRKYTAEQIKRLSKSARLRLDPTPIPEISQAVLTLFQVPQSVVNHLPQMTRQLFGVSVRVELSLPTTPRPIIVTTTRRPIIVTTRRPIIVTTRRPFTLPTTRRPSRPLPLP